MKPLADRVRAINEAPLPANIKALRGYLGMINFYRRFIPGQLKFCNPSTICYKGRKRATCPLFSRRKTSFSESKRALPNAKMLAHPIPGAPISLAVDAFDFAIGAVLQQRANDTWQPLGFLTKPLNCAQRKYSAYDGELLAMYTAVKRFRHAVEGRNFIIFIDHKPHTYAFSQNPDKCSPRQFRQLDYIGQFTTDIRHIKGLNNNAADALPRIEAIEKSVDHKTLAAAQENDKELRDIINSDISALQLKKIRFPDYEAEI